MLKKWLNKVLSGRQSRQTEVRKEIIPAEEYRINADMISFAAEKTVKRLQEEGFKAYIVGGAVRDLLLGVEPKDFDVATDATPEQVRKIFRRSRIIGRVSMDMITVELDASKEGLGAEVELWGDIVNINEVAEAAGMIPYEILCDVKRAKFTYSE